MTYTAIVAEDEEAVRDHVTRLLAASWADLEVIGTAANGVEALELIDSRRADVAFLDIQMPGLTGIEVARRAQTKPSVVFITAHDNYAVSAFERGAIDYLLKPIEKARLDATVERLQEKLASKTPAQGLDEVLDAVVARLERPKDYLRWVRHGVGNVVTQTSVDDVIYFKAEDKYTRVVTANSDALIRVGMTQLAQSLNPQSFARAHRSIIVNLAKVKTIRRNELGALELTLEGTADVIPVSRAHSETFRQM